MGRKRIAVYLRLSKVDDCRQTDISNSIVNQKNMIDKYIAKNFDYYVCNYYIDDGYSGMNYNRPEFKNMLYKAMIGEIDIIIVKDLSRLGREYLETGRYINNIFPSLNIRFISINDDYDSDRATVSQKHLIIPIKSFINECYSRDISKKVRSNLYAMRKNGKYVGAYVAYGYKKNDMDSNTIEIDKEASELVKLIYCLYLYGFSINEIRTIMDDSKYETPYEHKRRYNKNYCSGFVGNEARWSYMTIRRILQNEVYIGNLVQGKRSTINYKFRKCVYLDEDKWVRVNNNHNPIVGKKEFFAVQRRLAIDSKASKKNYFLSGKLKCKYCGNNFIRRTGKNNKYICSEYNRTRKCYGGGINEQLGENILSIILKWIKDFQYEYKNVHMINNINLKEGKIDTLRHDIYQLNINVEDIVVDVKNDKQIVLVIKIIR